MFDNIIEFSSQERIIENKNIHPVPCKLNIPEWFKELDHSVNNRTIKGCVPFLETLTTGYIIKAPLDYYIEHNVPEGHKRRSFLDSSASFENSPEGLNLNYIGSDHRHPIEQLGKCPFIKKNKEIPFHKILNPWIIKTPPGYSCLFLPPLNNSDDRFSIIPGIVDTDKFPGEINFPMIINGDKYPILKTVIKMGTPLVQVIPFKRNSWKMKIKEHKKENSDKFKFKLKSKLIHSYKSLWWSKKTWK